jgi:hypothetical protein
MIQKPYSPFLLISIVFVITLSACASPEMPEPTLDMNAIFTQVAATIAMDYTQTVMAMPTATNTPEPTFTPPTSPTPQPTIEMTPTVAPSPTFTGPTPLPINPATAYGCYNAALVTDVTVPAGTNFKPGNSFSKTWRLVNTGTCDWTGEFKITYVGGNLFGSDTTKIRRRVGVGGIADISLEMVAPSGSSGTVVSNWQMATDAGNLFGPVLTVSIVLPGGNPTATSVGCYNSALVSETIPSGSRLDPGERFEKTWQIKNTGTCDWTRDFKFTFAGGYDFQGADPVRIPKKITPGSTVEIYMSIDAPDDPDSYSSSWQMATDEGNFFGQVFTIEIKVK